ncbi:MAG: hypothetical protein ACLSG9_10105 [Eubacterium sp.]
MEKRWKLGIEALSRGAAQAALVEPRQRSTESVSGKICKAQSMKDRAVVLPVEATYGVSKLKHATGV